jgi:hypothetical protein
MKIEFIPSSKEHGLVVPMPRPASEYLPRWYSDMKMFAPDNTPKVFNGKPSNITIKACAPFLDSLEAGYIQETWCDIWFDNDTPSGEVSYSFASSPRIISSRPSSSIPMKNDYYYSTEFTWLQSWVPKTPKGWSVLITQPFNNPDSPFFTTTGIIDSDVFYHARSGQHPFYLRKGFSGLIPAGTPMYQIIPIKRENWDAVKVGYNLEEHTVQESKIFKNFWGAYRKTFRQKKVYR